MIPGSGRSPGEGNGNPLQYSCLENSMDGGAWWDTIHGVEKSWTRLSDFTFTLHMWHVLRNCSSRNIKACPTVCLHAFTCLPPTAPNCLCCSFSDSSRFFHSTAFLPALPGSSNSFLTFAQINLKTYLIMELTKLRYKYFLCLSLQVQCTH